jgi:hypothetical protein
VEETMTKPELTAELLNKLFEKVEGGRKDDEFCEHEPRDFIHEGWTASGRNVYTCPVCKKTFHTHKYILSPDTEARLREMKEFGGYK